MSRLLSDPWTQLLLLAFVLLTLLTAGAVRRARRANPLRARLAALPAHDADAPAAADPTLSITHAGLPLPAPWPALARFGAGLAGGTQDREKLVLLLTKAGWRRAEAVGLLMVAKYGAGLVLALLALFGWLSPQSRFGMTGLATALIAFFAGTALVELLVKMRAARRYEALSRAMPDALDLMVICAEAGLPFPRIMKVVARELALSAPVMADELTYTSSELQLLPDRANALRHLAERTRVPAIQSMVGSLIQAERYGTPLAQALRTIAQESRSAHILALEEKAGKLPAQLSVPLMTLILPPVVALVASPALMRVIRSLMQ